MKDTQNRLNAKTGLQIAILCVLWIAVSVAGRMWIETPSFKPVMAVAILAGFFLRDLRLAILVPMLTMATTDFFLGSYEWPVMISVYACVALPALWSKLVPAKGLKGLFLSANLGGVASAIAFYVITNFTVFAFTPWYTKDLQGLTSCYLNAIPFLYWMLLGNLFFVNTLGLASAISLKLSQETEESLSLEKAC